MDVMIAGVQRSGTTMLAGALTYKRRYVLNEPGSVRPTLKRIHNIVKPERWGVKQVRASLVNGWIAVSSPKKIVLMIRDIRHVAASVWEGHHRKRALGMHINLPTGQQISRMKQITRLILKMEQWDNTRVVRYEDFVTKEKVRTRLEEWLDWPLLGDPAKYQRQTGAVRSFEVERHGGKITDASVKLRRKPTSPQIMRYAERAVAACKPYQDRFYGT